VRPIMIACQVGQLSSPQAAYSVHSPAVRPTTTAAGWRLDYRRRLCAVCGVCRPTGCVWVCGSVRCARGRGRRGPQPARGQ
jgi:hypothetical protein